MNAKTHHPMARPRRRRPLSPHLSHAGTGGSLICLACRKVMTFGSEALEAFEEQVAWRHGFTLLTCKLVLYGLCQSCLDSKRREEER